MNSFPVRNQCKPSESENSSTHYCDPADQLSSYIVHPMCRLHVSPPRVAFTCRLHVSRSHSHIVAHTHAHATRPRFWPQYSKLYIYIYIYIYIYMLYHDYNAFYIRRRPTWPEPPRTSGPGRRAGGGIPTRIRCYNL
jgi:hypothetical protein